MVYDILGMDDVDFVVMVGMIMCENGVMIIDCMFF